MPEAFGIFGTYGTAAQYSLSLQIFGPYGGFRELQRMQAFHRLGFTESTAEGFK